MKNNSSKWLLGFVILICVSLLVWIVNLVPRARPRAIVAASGASNMVTKCDYGFFGDVNFDQVINAKDLQIINKIINSTFKYSEDSLLEIKWMSDVNGDGFLDKLDTDLVRQCITNQQAQLPENVDSNYESQMVGDVNGDGLISSRDVDMLSLYLMDDDLDLLALWRSDVNLDKMVTVQDRDILWFYVNDLITDLPYVWIPFYMSNTVGDVNMNNLNDVVDAMFIGQFEEGLREMSPLQQWLGDVNGDGLLSDADVELAMQYGINMDVEYTDFINSEYREVLFGDLNDDYQLNNDDVNLLISYLDDDLVLSPVQLFSIDLDGNKMVNSMDLEIMKFRLQNDKLEFFPVEASGEYADWWN